MDSQLQPYNVSANIPFKDRLNGCESWWLSESHLHHLVRSGGCLLQNCLMAPGGLEEIRKESSGQSFKKFCIWNAHDSAEYVLWDRSDFDYPSLESDLEESFYPRMLNWTQEWRRQWRINLVSLNVPLFVDTPICIWIVTILLQYTNISPKFNSKSKVRLINDDIIDSKEYNSLIHTYESLGGTCCLFLQSRILSSSTKRRQQTPLLSYMA
jgi:hypothetical protein